MLRAQAALVACLIIALAPAARPFTGAALIYWQDLQNALKGPGGRRSTANDADILWYGIDRSNRETAIPSHMVERQSCDAYQWALLISTHEQRHILQIREIKSDAGFPKK